MTMLLEEGGQEGAGGELQTPTTTVGELFALPKSPVSRQQVDWTDIFNLGLTIDKLLKERSYSYTQFRPDLNILDGDESNSLNADKGIPLFNLDYTTPFACDFDKKYKKKYYLCFEFGCYNYQRGTSNKYVYTRVPGYIPSNKRYYNPPKSEERYLRYPILHSMYASDTAVMGEPITYDKLLTKKTGFMGSTDDSTLWVLHLMENPMDKIKIFWPEKGLLYRKWGYNGNEQISADLYVRIEINNCYDVLRIASTGSLEGDGTGVTAYANNGNYNRGNNAYSTVPFDTAQVSSGGGNDDGGDDGVGGDTDPTPGSPDLGITPGGGETGTTTISMPYDDGVLFTEVNFGKYLSERIPGKKVITTPPPPMCKNCVYFQFPKIGLEGGFKRPAGDVKALYAFGKDVSVNVIPATYAGATVGHWWPLKESDMDKYGGTKKKLPTDKMGYRLPEYDHLSKWVWPHEINYYDLVSDIVDLSTVIPAANLSHVKVRVTNLRFMAGRTYGRNDLMEAQHSFKTLHCVKVITGFIVEGEGYLTTAIRRRWYDMLYFASKYIMGYLPKLEEELSDGSTDGSADGGGSDGEGDGKTETKVDTIGYNPENPKHKLKKLLVTGTSWNAYVEENEHVEKQFPVCGRWRKWGLDYASLDLGNTSIDSDGLDSTDAGTPALLADDSDSLDDLSKKIANTSLSGNIYWENYLAVRDTTDFVNGDKRGEIVPKKYKKGIENGNCDDLIWEKRVGLPWFGGGENTKSECFSPSTKLPNKKDDKKEGEGEGGEELEEELGAGAKPLFRTHARTVGALKTIIGNLFNYKIDEKGVWNGGMLPVTGWQGCVPDAEKAYQNPAESDIEFYYEADYQYSELYYLESIVYESEYYSEVYDYYDYEYYDYELYDYEYLDYELYDYEYLDYELYDYYDYEYYDYDYYDYELYDYEYYDYEDYAYEYYDYYDYDQYGYELYDYDYDYEYYDYDLYGYELYDYDYEYYDLEYYDYDLYDYDLYDYYDDGYYDDGYYDDGYYDDGYYDDGYYDDGGSYDDDGYYDDGGSYDDDGSYDDGYYDDEYYDDGGGAYDDEYDDSESDSGEEINCDNAPANWAKEVQEEERTYLAGNGVKIISTNADGVSVQVLGDGNVSATVSGNVPIEVSPVTVVERYTYRGRNIYTVKAKPTENGWVLSAGLSLNFDAGYTNPTTFNESVSKNVNVRFSYTGQSTVTNGVADSSIVQVNNNTTEECIRVDVDAKKVYVKRITTYTINSTVNASDVANCIKLSASNGFTITTNALGLCQLNGLSISVNPVSITVLASKKFEQGSITYLEDDESIDVQKSTTKTYGPTTETGSVNVTVSGATKAIRSIDTNTNNVNASSSYNNTRMLLMLNLPNDLALVDAVEPAIQALTELSKEIPTSKTYYVGCDKWQIKEKTDTYIKYWCTVFKMTKFLLPNTGSIPYYIWNALKEEKCKTKLVKSSSEYSESVSINTKDCKKALATINDILSNETAFKEEDEVLIKLDPNYGQSGLVRGYTTGTFFRTYLISPKIEALKITIKTPLKRGAVKGNQYRFKAPYDCHDKLTCTLTLTVAETVNLVPKRESDKYGAIPEDKAGDCQVLLGPNEGGVLYAKPFVISDTVALGPVHVIEGGGTVCPEKEDPKLTDYEYANSTETEYVTKFILPADRDKSFHYRVQVGITFALNSFHKGIIGKAGAVNNLDAYIFTPTTETVLVKVLKTTAGEEL